VAAGELVEFYVVLEHDHPVAQHPKIRFDVLELTGSSAAASTTPW
jgi:hypothetical protein